MFRRKRTVHFEESVSEPSDAEFNIEFSKYNRSSLYMVLVFLMTCAVQFCLELDRMMLQATQDAEVSCVTSEHRLENFSHAEMISLTYPELRSACMHFSFDKSMFVNKTFDESREMVKKIKKPNYTSCGLPLDLKYFSWERDFMGTCKSFWFRHRLHIVFHVGSSMGYIAIGIVADLYGRKIAFCSGLCFWLLGILCLPINMNFWLTQLASVVKGFGKAGLFLTSTVLFLEICNKYYRGILTLYVTCFGPIAELVGVVLKHNMEINVLLKYTFTLPSLILLFYAWYMPESPKWYLSYGQKRKAWEMLERLGTDIQPFVFLPPLKFKMRKMLKENFAVLFASMKYRKCLFLCTLLVTFIQKISNTKKLYVTLRQVRVASHRHLIILAEIASFMYVLPPFIILGRHLALCWFVMLTLVQLCLSLLATFEWIYIFNILIVLTVHALEMVMKLYICEIFPTCSRCTSAGFIYGLSTAFYLSHSLFDEIAILDYAIENSLFILYALFSLILLSTLPSTGAYELPDHKRYRNEVEQQPTN